MTSNSPEIQRTVPSGNRLAMRYSPPTRSSMVAASQVTPAGPHHLTRCAGSVQYEKRRSAGASISRRTIRVAALLGESLTTIDSALRRAPFALLGEGRERIQGALPELPVLVQPRVDGAEWLGVEVAAL